MKLISTGILRISKVMNDGNDCDKEGLTLFKRLAEEDEEDNCSGSSGFVSNLFGRFWKPHIATNNEEIERSASHGEGPTAAVVENENEISPNIPENGQNSSTNLANPTISNVFFSLKYSNLCQYWMPDSTGRECYQCEERFSTFRRRHHCRLCGQIFCSKCCSIHIPGISLGYTGDLRLCDYCAKIMAQYLPQEEERREKEPSSSCVVKDECKTSMLDALSNVQFRGLVQNLLEVSAVDRGIPCTSNIVNEPSVLCVSELYSHCENRCGSDIASPRVGLLDEDSGPDWFRNMGPDTITSEKDNHKMFEQNIGADDRFDPVPISSNLDASSEAISDKKSVKISVSPSFSKTRLDDDIDQSFDLRAEHLLSYLCLRERLNDLRWTSIIFNLAKEIAGTVKIDVANRHDSMNILNYVHVKKVLVDHEHPNAELVWGVVCSKSVVHESMAEPLKDASIMIVAGSIEYERISGRLTTLEPILNQEVEFLAKQVERILSRRPCVLLVEGNVSRLASDLLRDAGVRVVMNVSERVLHRVARSTGADILPSSDAQLIQQSIGFCPHFSQRTVLFKDGRKKFYLVFNGCHSDRGCSILLKGQDARELKAVKRVLLFLTSVLYSSHLERAFLNMFNIRMTYQISNCAVCEARREVIEQKNEKSDFEKSLISSVLSTSPFIDYEPPYLESTRGRNCSLIPYFNVPVYHFYTAEDFDARKIEEENEVKRSVDLQCLIPTPSTPRHHYAINGARDAKGVDDLISFRALGGAIFKKRVRTRHSERSHSPHAKFKDRRLSRRHDMLDPYVHQRVAVLFGSFSPKSPNAPYFCVRPWVVSMEFYGSNDMTLGEFLTKFCFNKSYECPSSNCEIPMLDHSRKLVYGRVCVEITTQIMINAAEDLSTTNSCPGQLYAWNYCNSCKLSSTVAAMSNSVWHLSFGKYLDYLAYASFSKCGMASLARQECSHCFFHEHTHFYSQGIYVASFKVIPVCPYNVQFSPVQCRIVPNQYAKQALLDGVTRMATLADDIIRTIRDRLLLFSQQHAENCNQYAESIYTVLHQKIDETTSLLEEKRKYAEELKVVDQSVIPSNDVLAIKANEALMYIREAIYQLITVWNDQCTTLANTIRTARKINEEGFSISEAMHIGMERIDDPFPSYLHLGLKLKPRVGIVVRDITDSKGNYKPDIGSIIAYALSTIDYERPESERNLANEDYVNLTTGSAQPEEHILSSEHLEIEFQDNQTSYYVKVYYAEKFRLLRKLLFTEGEEAFIRSLSQSTSWTPQGGKSGSFFYRTQDDRFVVKQMSRFEIQSFIGFAPHYLDYIKTAVIENKLTSLCKVYGVFRVGYKSKTTQLKVDILVMEYLFYKCNVDQVWDLKGSLRNRMAATGKRTSDLVLLDENLMNDLWNKQLYIYPHAKAALNQAISNDSHFLSSQHVMDYSLLVGVDERNNELILGIVDYMRTYTLDKKLESWVKIVAIPGAHLPTILSPEMYCTRFSEAIDTYFPVVPDQWTGLGSAVSY
ncbi:FYVE zinc finger [Dictyocaulus viviparus]|uniref:1-phosphatidylinositol-3-phosphate 5-kinase n=1 Tax=Dictyocaulus viviparus TaxID=29172 RepID=A0A0D8YBW0_DICVI|nr:FYVE zinc finger [Dictyocaulus viviparus]